MNEKVIILAVCGLLLYVGLSGCVEEENKKQDSTDTLKNLAYKSYGYGINPPEEYTYNHGVTNFPSNDDCHWYVNDSSEYYEVIFELEEKVSPYNRKNASLAISNGAEKNENISLEEYASSMMKNLYNFYTNITYVSNETKKENSMDYYITVFSGDYGGKDTYISKYVYVEKYDIIFTLIYTASENLYDEYIDVVGKSINSFKIQ